MSLFKDGFWFWLARRVPQALRYHVVIMCTADYSVAFPTTPVPPKKVIDIVAWLRIKEPGQRPRGQVQSSP